MFDDFRENLNYFGFVLLGLISYLFIRNRGNFCRRIREEVGI